METIKCKTCQTNDIASLEGGSKVCLRCLIRTIKEPFLGMPLDGDRSINFLDPRIPVVPLPFLKMYGELQLTVPLCPVATQVVISSLKDASDALGRARQFHVMDVPFAVCEEPDGDALILPTFEVKKRLKVWAEAYLCGDNTYLLDTILVFDYYSDQGDDGHTDIVQRGMLWIMRSEAAAISRIWKREGFNTARNILLGVLRPRLDGPWLPEALFKYMAEWSTSSQRDPVILRRLSDVPLNLLQPDQSDPKAGDAE